MTTPTPPTPTPDAEEWQFQIERAFDGLDGSSWFTGHLLRLISKADQINRERIRLGFPEAVAAWEAWLTNGGRIPDDWTAPAEVTL